MPPTPHTTKPSRRFALRIGELLTGGALALIMFATAEPAIDQARWHLLPRDARQQLIDIHDAAGGLCRGHRTPEPCENDEPSACGGFVVRAGVTPPLAVNCNEGPNGRCQASLSQVQVGSYSIVLWQDNPVWAWFGVSISQPHDLHYDVEIAGSPNGPLSINVYGFLDRDNDGTFSTIERRGRCVNGALEVDKVRADSLRE